MKWVKAAFCNKLLKLLEIQYFDNFGEVAVETSTTL